MFLRSFNQRRGEEGSTLLIALCITTILTLTLGGYLLMVRAQHTTVVRSQGWNAALSMAEAGVEEVLAQLNPGESIAIADRSLNGWGTAKNGIYGPQTRTLGTGSYDILFTDDASPTIYSTGHVVMPALSATLTRVIKVTTSRPALYTAALATVEDINFNGNGVYTDSFNSSDPTLSTNGRYDPAKASTNGDVASLEGVVNVGNGDIHGNLLLGAVSTDSISKNGSVSGGVTHDFNADFADVVLPTTSWVIPTPQSTTINGVTYDYAFMNSGDFVIASSGATIYVNTNAHVRLNLTGSGAGNIRVAGMDSSAGHLEIYMSGASFGLSGSSSVDGGKAANLAYYGLPSNTSISMSGNATFTGTIYAPEAAFKMSGGGSSPYDFVGSCMVKSASVSGHFSFHYDEALQTAGPSRGYLVTSWSELKPGN